MGLHSRGGGEGGGVTSRSTLTRLSNLNLLTNLRSPGSRATSLEEPNSPASPKTATQCLWRWRFVWLERKTSTIFWKKWVDGMFDVSMCMCVEHLSSSDRECPSLVGLPICFVVACSAIQNISNGFRASFCIHGSLSFVRLENPLSLEYSSILISMDDLHKLCYF